MSMEAKRKRGRTGLGGSRLMLKLTPELDSVLDEQMKLKQNVRVSRAELIRIAIEAWYIPLRKRPTDRGRAPRQ